MFLSFVPVRVLQRIFPPVVTGTVILLIGASLVGDSGIANWGGGSNDCMDRPSSGYFELCPNIAAPRPLPYVIQDELISFLLEWMDVLLVKLNYYFSSC